MFNGMAYIYQAGLKLLQKCMYIYLCKCISEGHGKEEVGICTASMNPEVPENRTKNRGEEKHHQNNQGVAEI